VHRSPRVTILGEQLGPLGLSFPVACSSQAQRGENLSAAIASRCTGFDDPPFGRRGRARSTPIVVLPRRSSRPRRRRRHHRVSVSVSSTRSGSTSLRNVGVTRTSAEMAEESRHRWLGEIGEQSLNWHAHCAPRRVSSRGLEVADHPFAGSQQGCRLTGLVGASEGNAARVLPA